MEQFEYPAGSIVFMSGDPSTKAYLIHSGTVELRRGTLNAEDRETQLGPGDVFGEQSLITEKPHTVSARVINPARLSVLTRDEFEQALSTVPGEVNAYIHSILERFRMLSAREKSSPSLPPSTIDAVSTEKVLVTLHPLTRRAAAALPHDGLSISRFPFRIGRNTSQCESLPPDSNDLWLDDRLPYHVSRNHALIDIDEGKVVLKDRGSSLGIVVNETVIGGKAEQRQKVLDVGDNIVVFGGATSPFQFRVTIQNR